MTPEQREHRDHRSPSSAISWWPSWPTPTLSAAERRELIRHKALMQHEVPFLGVARQVRVPGFVQPRQGA